MCISPLTDGYGKPGNLIISHSSSSSFQTLSLSFPPRFSFRACFDISCQAAQGPSSLILPYSPTLRRRYAHTDGSAHWRLTIHRSHLSSLFPLSFFFLFRVGRTADGAIHGGGILSPKEKVCISCSCAIRLGFDQHFLLSSLRQDFFKEGGGGWVDHAFSPPIPPNHQRRM